MLKFLQYVLNSTNMGSKSNTIGKNARKQSSNKKSEYVTIYRKIMQILEKDGIYKNDFLFIIDRGKYYLAKSDARTVRYKCLMDIVVEHLYFDSCKHKWKPRLQNKRN